MMSRLRELGELTTGYQLRTAADPEPDGKYGLVRLGDVSDDGISEANLIRMNLTDIDEAKFLLAAEDVVCRSRGASFQAKTVDGFSAPTIALAPLYRYRADRSRVLPGFVAWWINMPDAQSHLQSAAIGSNIRTIPIAAFGDVPVPMVPMELQAAVVEIDRLNVEERRLEHELAERRATQIELSLCELVKKTAKGDRR